MGIKQAIDIDSKQKKELLTLFNTYLPNTKIWAYGSRVKWSAKPSSDLDLVAFSQSAQASAVSKLKDALVESDLPFKVDLLTWDNIPNSFQVNIKENYFELQSDKQEGLPSGWRVVELNLISKIIDSRHKTPIYSNNGRGLAMVRVVNIKGGLLSLENAKLVSEDVYADFSKGRNPKIGDLIISRVGSYGNISYVKSFDKFCLGQNTALIIPKSVNWRFLYYELISSNIKNQIELFVVGAVQRTISLKSIQNLKINLPPLPEQKAIAHILGTLDDKIELNRQINQTLETMAQTLFKSWFVNFDPVIDNAIKAGNPIPDPLKPQAQKRKTIKSTLPKTTQDLFPNRFVFNENLKKWIPEGWNIDELSQEIDVLNGYAFKRKDYIQKGLFLLRTKNFNSEKLVNTLSDDVYLPEYFSISHAKYLCEPFDYHLIMVGASVGNRGLIQPHNLPALRNQNMWCFRPNKNSITSKSFVKFMLDSIIKSKIGLASGSAREFFRKGDFQKQLIIFSNKRILKEFEKLATPLQYKQGLIGAENSQLTKLRNTLLPKLISGKIRVKNKVIKR